MNSNNRLLSLADEINIIQPYLFDRHVEMRDYGGKAPLVQEGKLSEQSIPLIIKRYRTPVNCFSNQLYLNYFEPLRVLGLKGRGLCLEAVPPGDIVIIAGGTGLFPFLDLIDEIFRLVVSSRHPEMGPHPQIRAILNSKSFHMFLSVNSFNELVMPDEMAVINNARSAVANIHIRVSRVGLSMQQHNAFSGFVLPTARFGRELVRQRLTQLTRIQMVYLCGPPLMCRDMS